MSNLSASQTTPFPDLDILPVEIRDRLLSGQNLSDEEILDCFFYNLGTEHGRPGMFYFCHTDYSMASWKGTGETIMDTDEDYYRAMQVVDGPVFEQEVGSSIRLHLFAPRSYRPRMDWSHCKRHSRGISCSREAFETFVRRCDLITSKTLTLEGRPGLDIINRSYSPGGPPIALEMSTRLCLEVNQMAIKMTFCPATRTTRVIWFCFDDERRDEMLSHLRRVGVPHSHPLAMVLAFVLMDGTRTISLVRRVIEDGEKELLRKLVCSPESQGPDANAPARLDREDHELPLEVMKAYNDKYATLGRLGPQLMRNEEWFSRWRMDVREIIKLSKHLEHEKFFLGTDQEGRVDGGYPKLQSRLREGSLAIVKELSCMQAASWEAYSELNRLRLDIQDWVESFGRKLNELKRREDTQGLEQQMESCCRGHVGEWREMI